MGRELSGEGQVVEPGDAEHGLVNTVALEPAVPQDLPVLQPGQGVFHPRSRPAVDGVLRLLLRAEVRLTSSFAVRDEQAGALVSAVGEGRCAAANPVDAAPRQTGLASGQSRLPFRWKKNVPAAPVKIKVNNDNAMPW